MSHFSSQLSFFLLFVIEEPLGIGILSLLSPALNYLLINEMHGICQISHCEISPSYFVMSCLLNEYWNGGNIFLKGLIL